MSQAVSVKVDHTIRLPHEILCSIIRYIPSLADKFKLAAMNSKFRRCVITELNKPMQLNINFYNGTLNGQKIPVHRWPQVMQALAPKTCFTQIRIVVYKNEDQLAERLLEYCQWVQKYEASIDQLLSPLAVSECLDEVRVFELVDLPSFVYDLSILTKVLAQCHKLSILLLDFDSRPLVSAGLCSIVANKLLTQLKLKLSAYNQGHLSKLFESLEPKMLHSLDLSFTRMESPNLVDLVSSSGAVWSGLRKMRLYYDPDIAVQHLDGLFGTVLPQLPLLQNCRIEFGHESFQEIETVAMALFNNSKRQQPTIVQIVLDNAHGLFGCVAVDLFTQLQQLHPDIKVDFDDEQMRVKLESVTLATAVFVKPHDGHCLQCRRVYTVVVEQLAVQAEERESLHLAHYRLDRCKANTIVMDLYVKRQLRQGHYYLPLSAVINEAGDLVVISFEDEDGDPFYITIDCVHCLSENCIGCVHI